MATRPSAVSLAGLLVTAAIAMHVGTALIATTQAQARSGQLDSSFARDGVLRTRQSPTEPGGVVHHRNGRTVVVGNTGSDIRSAQGIAAARFRRSGMPDRAFGSAGHVSIDSIGYLDFGTDVLFDRDGKILLGGWTQSRSAGRVRSWLVVIRLTRGGDLDVSFGEGGVVTLGMRGNYSGLHPSLASSLRGNIALDSRGRIVAAGTLSRPGAGFDFGVARLRRSGTPDRSFGGNGLKRVTFGRRAFLGDVAIDRDDRIVLVGNAGYEPSDFAAARLRPSGRLDDSFSGNGRKTLDVAGDDVADALAIGPRRSMLITGRADDAFALVKLDRDGSLSRTFAARGVQEERIREYAQGTGVALGQDDDIVVSAITALETRDGQRRDYDFAALRFRPSGRFDRSFSQNGKAILRREGEDFATALDLAPSGKIVLAGRSQRTPRSASRLMIVRYRP